MRINNSWNFKELVYNLPMLKQEYDKVLAFFLSWDNSIKIKNHYVKRVRDAFYSLNLKEWQIDVCWEYMNNYRFYYEVVRIIKKIDN